MKHLQNTVRTSRDAQTFKDLHQWWTFKRGLPSYLDLKLHSIVSVFQSGHSEPKASP